MFTGAPAIEDDAAAAKSALGPENLYAAIFEHAQASTSQHAYLTKVLREIAEAFASPYAAIYVQHGSDVIALHHGREQDGEFWEPGVQSFLTEVLAEPGSRARLLESSDSATKIALLAANVVDTSGHPIGAIALAVARSQESDAARKLTQLEAVAYFASYAWADLSTRQDPKERMSDGASHVLGRASNCNTPEELAFAITNDLRNKLQCEQVALGVPRRRRINILSISGLDHVTKQSPGVRDLRAAMEECLDFDTVIACQDSAGPSDGAIESKHRLHEQWRSASNGDAVVSIPLHANEELVAVLSLRRPPVEPFTPEQIKLIQAQVEPLAATLRLLRKAGRGWARHTLDGIGAQISSVTSRGRTGRKIAVGLAAVALAWVCFGTMDYGLTVPAAARAKQSRHVTAPFDAVISAAAVIEGDSVKRGDVLCRLDRKELQQQEAELIAEINVLERKKDQAMGADDAAGFQLALANQKLAFARLDSTKTRIARCTVRSPIDGVVVSGDLRKNLGSTVALGEELFEIAPPDQLVLELEVPEADIDDVTVALSGYFASQARPGSARAFRIARIQPRTEVREGGNVCIVEASIQSQHAWERPGMEGTARIHVGRRRIAWVALHRLVDYLRLNLWL